MNSEDFNRLYIGNFSPDERSVALYDRIKGYYQCVDSAKYKSERNIARSGLSEWLRVNEYTLSEVRQMKHSVCKELGI